MRPPLFAFGALAAALSLMAGACSQPAAQSEPHVEAVVSDQRIDPAMLAGDWMGVLDVGGAQLRLQLELEHGEAGLAGRIVSVDQGGAVMPLSAVTLQGARFSFEVAQPPFSFDGAVRAENVIAGTFTQNGRDFPLEFTAQSSAQPQTQSGSRDVSADERETLVQAPLSDAGETLTLAGALRAPEDARAGVVILSGSGPQDRNGMIAGQPLYATWAEVLANQGVASLRLDDRGVGGSERVIPESPVDLGADAAAALDHLRSETGLSCVGFMGHSEGGLIALLAAERAEPDFIVSMAGMHESMEQTLLRQSEAIIRASGGGDAAVEGNRALQQAMFAVLRTAEPEDDIRGALEAALVEAGAPASLAESQAAIWGQPYAAASFQLNPAEPAARYSGPLLALFGGNDLQVLAEPNSAALIAARPGLETRTVTIDGVDHLFHDNPTGAPSAYGSAGHAISPAAAQAIAAEITALIERSCS